MRNALLGTFIISIVLISCQSEPQPDITQQPVTYMPATAGSTWNYELINNVPPATTTAFILTATTKDSVVNVTKGHALFVQLKNLEYKVIEHDV